MLQYSAIPHIPGQAYILTASTGRTGISRNYWAFAQHPEQPLFLPLVEVAGQAIEQTAFVASASPGAASST